VVTLVRVAESLEDATMCLKLRPDWFKAYYRRAVALNKMGRNVEARGMCMGGLALDKDNKELRQLRDQVPTAPPLCRLHTAARPGPPRPSLVPHRPILACAALRACSR
jgi:hypothetical protein